MGMFMYGGEFRAQFHDRLLRHLQIVIGAKLARNERFMFTWRPSKPMGAERITVWMTPTVAVQFQYDGSRIDPINRNWVNALSKSANSSMGLEPLAEPGREVVPAVEQK